MSTLGVRIASALLFLVIFVATIYFSGTQGLFVLCTICVFRVGYEYGRIIFEKTSLSYVFGLLSALLFLLYFYRPEQFLILFAMALTALLAALTLQASRGVSLQKIAALQSSSVLGLFYCVLLPVFVVELMYLKPNIFWLVIYLCIVFAGDTCAYFGGYFFGKTKLLEPVSPKKTVEGAIGGILGSLLVAALVSLRYSTDLIPLLLGALGTACLAQMGDLFESLLKRVANVKDSGHFMPGHGGLMDRLDGVYLAAPFFYFVLKMYID